MSELMPQDAHDPWQTPRTGLDDATPQHRGPWWEPIAAHFLLSSIFS